MRIYSSHLNILCFFSHFYFFGHKYKGHDFLRAGAFAPVAPPSATRLQMGDNATHKALCLVAIKDYH